MYCHEVIDRVSDGLLGERLFHEGAVSGAWGILWYVSLSSERTVYYEFGSNEFEWDEDKALLNISKHGISFEEAASAFEDEYAVILPNEEHSIDEFRFVLLGRTNDRRVLSVIHVERAERLRIISARKTTERELRDYDRARRIGF